MTVEIATDQYESGRRPTVDKALNSHHRDRLEQQEFDAGEERALFPPEPSLTRSRSETQHTEYSRRLYVTDALVVCGAMVSGDAIRFSGHPAIAGATAAGLGILWMIFLSMSGSRSRRVIGSGFGEYAAIVLATLQLFGLAAISAQLFELELSRGYLAIALPLGVAGLICTRSYWRHAAAARRRTVDPTSVLVVGTQQVARNIARMFARDPEAGYQVVGICTPSGPVRGATSIRVEGQDIPIVGIDEAIVGAVRETGVHTVAMAATDHLKPTEIRRLMWELEALGVDLMVSPGLVDVADERLHSRAVAGMAMLEVTKPQYSRANSLAKRTFDVLFTVAALFVAAPIMAAAAIAVKLSSPGPVFYASERIGRDGNTFKMIKFRSMCRDADRHYAQMVDDHEGSAIFFKVKDDPRVTPIGRILRKFSIDELPQFFNVLRGEMSVVGPRPQARREVDCYDDLFRRRLSVKPGLTGLWQVSGRSDLHVEEAVRLDLSYVENWSPVQDLAIIARTVMTVLRGDGAY